jgi:RNA polymerase sigma-70 factor, ECF subfamily
VSPPDPHADASDDELMRRAAHDARDAFAALLARHGEALLRFCRKLTGEAAAGEEVAQETWLRLWAARGRYAPRGRFLPLLYATARNQCWNHLRGRRRRLRWLVPTPEAGALEHPATPGARDALLAREQDRLVLEAMARLPGTLREALLLRFDQGFAYADMARIVGRSESTLRSRVFHGLRRLHQELERSA